MLWGNVHESEKRLMYNCEKYHDIIMVLSWLSCYHGNHHDFHGIMGFFFGFNVSVSILYYQSSECLHV